MASRERAMTLFPGEQAHKKNEIRGRNEVSAKGQHAEKKSGSLSLAPCCFSHMSSVSFSPDKLMCVIELRRQRHVEVVRF